MSNIQASIQRARELAAQSGKVDLRALLEDEQLKQLGADSFDAVEIVLMRLRDI